MTAALHLPTREAANLAAPDDAIRAAIGYRVVGPEGDLGAIVGVPEAGSPQRPLVLVVRYGSVMRFVPLRRVAGVSPLARLLILNRDEAVVR